MPASLHSSLVPCTAGCTAPGWTPDWFLGPARRDKKRLRCRHQFNEKPKKKRNEYTFGIDLMRSQVYTGLPRFLVLQQKKRKDYTVGVNLMRS